MIPQQKTLRTSLKAAQEAVAQCKARKEAAAVGSPEYMEALHEQKEAEKRALTIKAHMRAYV